MNFSNEQNNRKGILLLLLAIAIFSSMDAIAKSLIVTYSPAQVIWIRFFGQMLLVCVILRHRLPAMVRTRYPLIHFFRAATQFGATTFFFLSLAHIGLTEATTVADINPVLITLGAALFLGEKLSIARVIGVVVSAIGALIVMRPGSAVFSVSAIFPLLCALSYAASALLTRFIGPRESPWASMFFAALLGTVVAGIAQPFVWVSVAPGDLGLFILVGCLGTAAQLALIRAYSVAEAAAIAPYSYAGIFFACTYSFLLFGVLPDAITLLGILVIVGAGLYVWVQEKSSTGEQK
jgi:drug/metabolite transporter (DMT)-like permease